MNNYKITREIDVSADTHEEAAKEALLIMRDSHSDATWFNVQDAYSGEIEEVEV